MRFQRDILGGDYLREYACSTGAVGLLGAELFILARGVLAGDAAHVTNPTMTLGLASGLLDSYVLVEALAAVVHGDRETDVA
jgi:2-polyprenyl-6-methoxyphenol hydroxylase-like FAD-dependent oxidoreductase